MEWDAEDGRYRYHGGADDDDELLFLKKTIDSCPKGVSPVLHLIKMVNARDKMDEAARREWAASHNNYPEPPPKSTEGLWKNICEDDGLHPSNETGSNQDSEPEEDISERSNFLNILASANRTFSDSYKKVQAQQEVVNVPPKKIQIQQENDDDEEDHDDSYTITPSGLRAELGEEGWKKLFAFGTTLAEIEELARRKPSQAKSGGTTHNE